MNSSGLIFSVVLLVVFATKFTGKDFCCLKVVKLISLFEDWTGPLGFTEYNVFDDPAN